MTDRKVVAIHQPNFFPWLGYFHKMSHADIFIVMDNVQFPKTGAGTWINRVQLLINGQPGWVTVPIVRAYHGIRQIKEMEINNVSPWREKLLATIQMNYARAPFFKEVFPTLMELINYQHNLLADYNLHILNALVATLNIDRKKLILGSSLTVQGNATDLLISMVGAVGGTTYLCGGGSAGYLEAEKFSEAGIELSYQNFAHPTYFQHNSSNFMPGLSIIDVLMNCGFAQTQELLSQG